ncbi:autotransporter adhesin [Bartonella fuyuanensis]|uniref:Autotransporter adhesin n=1 Tax=Bartonella fuyuanensis TaxID=1460968 RepID=A0A840DWJ3_9HYPH|nr:Vomp family autotransporter [Bartonella fuyuanensis]MBB4076023.1 autotransporter adhesin [Bartonella fuyuanensis]
MKKKYSTPNLIKAVSLSAVMGTLLSSVSPVFAANLAIVGGVSQSTPGSGVVYPYGSHGSIVLSGDDDYCGVDHVLGRGGEKQENDNRNVSRISVEEQYNRFINGYTESNGRDPYGTTLEKATWITDGVLSVNATYMGPTGSGGLLNVMPEAYGVYSFATGCGSSATGNYSTAFGAGATAKAGGAQAFGVSSLASGKATVAIGIGSEASGESAIAFGGLATASGKSSVALGVEAKAEQEYAIAIGARAEAKASGAIAIGGAKSDRTSETDPQRRAIAEAENAIAIGSSTLAKLYDTVAIGANAQALVSDGVAVGGGSVSDRAKGVNGYDPFLNGASTDTRIAWKSTAGAFSVGEVGGSNNGTLTRQITGVAAGSEDTDAVNVAQLKAMKDLVSGVWQLSVEGTDPTDVNPGNTIDLSVKDDHKGGKDNLIITKKTVGDKHKIEFSLNNILKLTSVSAGGSIMSDDGFFVQGGGPYLTQDGISAGGKTIGNVADAIENDEAVNYKQLKEVKALAEQGWKLSVDGNNATDVGAGSTVDLVAALSENGSKNIKIEKNNNNKVTFSLNDILKLTSVTTGNSIMSDEGFKFIDGNGPSITLNGLDAGDKKIINVADATENSEAVNYKQLKEVKTLAEQGWKLSVDGNNATDVGAGSTVDLVAALSENGSKNIKIEKNNNNKVTFSLNDILKLTSVTTGNSIMSDEGFKFIDGGPSITAHGINAGNKKIIGVAKGEDDTDAVNFSQLKEIKDQIDSNSLVKWDEEDKTIYIGAEKDGIELDITNKDGQFRVITGVAEGEYDDDAVNYKQLKEVKALAEQGWKLSVDGNNATDVGAGSTVDFIAGEDNTGNKNIQIAKSNDNKVTFSLNDNLKLTSVMTGRSIMSDDGFGFEGNKGPRIAFDGIFAANTKITGLQKGTNEEDAVNVSQLNEMRDQIADNSLVKWHEEQQRITIGEQKSGTKIDVANSNGENRIISGVADGSLRQDSTEVVNGSQINKISGDIAKFFGGDAAFQDGIFVGPKYNLSTVSANGEVERKVFDNVGKALEGLDINVKNMNKHIQYVDNKFDDKFDKFSQDALLWSEKEQAFVALHGSNGEKTESKLKFINDGNIDVDSLDAINGSQLYKMVKQIANYFGGGASYEDEKWRDPTFKVVQVNDKGEMIEKTHHNVAEAFEDVDNSITDIYNQINNVTKNSLVKQEGEDGRITIGKATDGTEISIINKDGVERTLSGVEKGTLSATSTEAVNGSQLFATNEKVTTVTNDLKKIAQNTSKYFGGSTDVLNGIEPSFLIQEEEYRNVTEAFIGVNTSITNIDNKISEVVKNSLVKQDATTSVITIGQDTAGTEINIAGYGKVERSISGVKAAEKGDEAVNKDQLDKSIEKISKDIETANAAAVLYDKDEDGKVNYGSVTLGGNRNNGPVVLHNVKDGNIAQDSYDAINGNQINKISADIAKFFGGGAKFINGAFEGLKYTLSAIVDGEVGKADFYDVGSALKGLDSNVQDVNKRLTNVSNEFNRTIEGISKDALLWDDKEEAFVARHEKDGKKTNSKLKYLLDGEIAQGSTDAITGNQLYLMSNQLANYFGGGAKYENGKWTGPTFKIVQVNADGTTVEKNHNNVSDAFGGINNNMSNINNRIDDVIKKVDSDALKWNNDKKAYDAGRDGMPNKIINVADGEIAEGSKDAVNGGQLWKTNERITVVEKDVEHLNNRVDNISNTIADIGDIVTNVNVKVDNIDNKVNDIAEDAVRYDRDENGKKTNKITLKGGDPSEPVLIDNVADGRIEKDSKEAVNGGQLHDYTQAQMKVVLDESKHYTDQRVNNIVIDAIDDAVERSNQYTDIKFNALNYSIESVKKEARQAAAIGLAVSNLRYNDIPGKLSIGFGTGLWRSQSAFAFGAGYTSEKGNIRSNVSVTTSGSHWGVGAGFNMTLN